MREAASPWAGAAMMAVVTRWPGRSSAREDFWSLVFHCRGGGPGHARPGAAPYYDVAYGPVASFWMQRNAMNGADQISFHSSACTPILVVKGVSTV